MSKPKNETQGVNEMNEVPTIHSEGITAERLNSLLDKITEKPFTNAALAIQAIRAALDLHGITLPVLEVEKGGTTTADGHSIQVGTSSMQNPDMYAPPVEGEWLYKIVDADGPDDDFDDYLYLYIVMDLLHDKDLGNMIDCFAQIISSEDIETIANMKDDDYQDEVGAGNSADHIGDRAGESIYQKQVRHIGGLRQDK